MHVGLFELCDKIIETLELKNGETIGAVLALNRERVGSMTTVAQQYEVKTKNRLMYITVENFEFN